MRKYRLKQKPKNVIIALLFSIFGGAVMHFWGFIFYQFVDSYYSDNFFIEISHIPEILIRLISAIIVFLSFIYICPKNYLKQDYVKLNKRVLIALFIILVLITFLGYLKRPFLRRLKFLFGLLSVSLYEETLFRICVLNLWLRVVPRTPKWQWIAIFLTSFQFGMFHISNIFAGLDTFYVIFQAIGATITGCVYCVITYETESVLYTIMLHSIHNCICGLINPTYQLSESTIINIATVIFMLYSIYYFMKYIFAEVRKKN